MMPLEQVSTSSGTDDRRRAVVGGLFAAALAGCGGGSDNNPVPTPPAPTPPLPPPPAPSEPLPPPSPPPAGVVDAPAAASGSIAFGPLVAISTTGTNGANSMGDPVHAASGSGAFDAYWGQAGLLEAGSSMPDPAVNIGTSRNSTGNTWEAPSLVGNLAGNTFVGSFFQGLQAYGLLSGTACLVLRSSAVLSRVIHVQRVGTTTTTVLASTQQGNDLTGLAGASDGSSQQAACWTDAAGVLVLRLSPANASTWSDPIVVAPSNASNPVVAVGANGRVLLAWFEFTVIKARVYDVASATLGPVITLNGALAGGAPKSSLAAAAFGNEFAVAWRQESSVSEVYVARTTGASWITAQSIETGTNDSVFTVKLLALPSGGLLALWARRHGVMASAFASGAWSSALRVVASPVGFSLEEFNAAVRQNGDTVIGCLGAGANNSLRAYVAVRLASGAAAPSTPLTDTVAVPLAVSVPRPSTSASGAVLITWYQRLGASTALSAANYARVFRP